MIVIDPGHGGDDPGAVGIDGLREAAVNLRAARLIRDYSPPRFTLTRESDETVSLADRVRLANEAEAAAFVAIHCNAAETPAADGFEVWTTPGETRADALALEVFGAVVRGSDPGQRFRADWDDGDPDREARFYVLRATRCPAILVELEFVTSPVGARRLTDSLWLENMTFSIWAGIRRWQRFHGVEL